MMPTPDRSIEFDAMHALLADSQRRELLSYLCENRQSTVEECVLTLATADGNESFAADDARERAKISLVHDHLPRLADHDVIDYDHESGDVVATAALDEFEPILDRLDESDSGTQQPPRSISNFS